MNNTIGENIKSFRIMRGLTQKQVAENTNLSITFISQIENGISNPSIESLEKIADILRVSVVDLKSKNGFTNFRSERLRIVKLLTGLTRRNRIKWDIKKGKLIKCKTEIFGNIYYLTFSETEHKNYSYIDFILENKEKNMKINFLENSTDEVYEATISLISTIMHPYEYNTEKEQANQIINDLESLLDE